MKGPARVFLARLAGVAVFDPAGDQIGRVRDVIMTLPPDAKRPRVLGLVVEVPPRRSVFIPITRVTSIDAGTVIFNGRINMRRFEQRSSEVRAIAEILDRRVHYVPDDTDVVVVDLAAEQTRTQDWVVTKVAIRPVHRLRRTAVAVVDWEQISGLGEIQDRQGAARFVATFDRMRAADIAGVVHDLPSKRRAEIATALDDERLADVLEELPEADQVEIIEKLELRRAADVLEEMGPDDAADLLAELPDDQREQLLVLMEPKEAAPLRRLLTYPDDTAGGLMTTEPVILPPDGTVAEALAMVRRQDLTPALAAQVYVCRAPTETPTGRYLGTVHFQRLLREPPSTLVSGICDTALDPLRPDRSLQAVAGYLATYNLTAVAIVDEGGHLHGAVSIDDVLDHLLPDDWRESALPIDTDQLTEAEEESVRSGKAPTP
jgi:flagellar motility protein MotE (MotC chaperone)